jgi:hypothetical protein
MKNLQFSLNITKKSESSSSVVRFNSGKLESVLAKLSTNELYFYFHIIFIFNNVYINIIRIFVELWKQTK